MIYFPYFFVPLREEPGTVFCASVGCSWEIAPSEVLSLRSGSGRIASRRGGNLHRKERQEVRTPIPVPGGLGGTQGQS